MDRIKRNAWDRVTGWVRRRVDDWVHHSIDQLLPEPGGGVPLSMGPTTNTTQSNTKRRRRQAEPPTETEAVSGTITPPRSLRLLRSAHQPIITPEVAHDTPPYAHSYAFTRGEPTTWLVVTTADHGSGSPPSATREVRFVSNPSERTHESLLPSSAEESVESVVSVTPDVALSTSEWVSDPMSMCASSDLSSTVRCDGSPRVQSMERPRTRASTASRVRTRRRCAKEPCTVATHAPCAVTVSST